MVHKAGCVLSLNGHATTLKGLHDQVREGRPVGELLLVAHVFSERVHTFEDLYEAEAPVHEHARLSRISLIHYEALHWIVSRGESASGDEVGAEAVGEVGGEFELATESFLDHV